MELKPGYKQTEVGVIPEDWATKSIKQISDPVRGGSPRPAGDPRFFNGTYIPWLTVAALTNIPESQLVVTETAACLTEEGSLRSRTLLPGTLIIANSGATLGVAKLLGVKCCANDGIAALHNVDKNVSAEYLAHFINTKTTYLREVVATGNGQPNLNTGLIGDFNIPVPPTKGEQEAIAEALSDADALIESLEQLLTKKRHLKQGAMQELLTGKTRLPGFSGEWERVKAGSIGTFRGGSGFPTKFQGVTDGEYPFFKVSDMNNEGNEKFMEAANNFISEASRKQLGATAFPRESIVFAKVGAAVFLERKKILLRESCLDNNMAAFVLDAKRAHYRFVHFVLMNMSFGDLVSTTALPSLNGSVLSGIELPLPPLPEQIAIADSLADMDAELSDLEAQLTKTRAVKQGMMQKLLTGEIRLVPAPVGYRA